MPTDIILIWNIITIVLFDRMRMVIAVLQKMCKNQRLYSISTELHSQMTPTVFAYVTINSTGYVVNLLSFGSVQIVYRNSENLILNSGRFLIDLDGNTINYWMHSIG